MVPISNLITYIGIIYYVKQLQHDSWLKFLRKSKIALVYNKNTRNWLINLSRTTVCLSRNLYNTFLLWWQKNLSQTGWFIEHFQPEMHGSKRLRNLMAKLTNRFTLSDILRRAIAMRFGTLLINYWVVLLVGRSCHIYFL